MDTDKIVERLRSRIHRQSQDVAIIGWKDVHHNENTLAWAQTGRVHFYDRLPDSGLPKAVSLALFTRYASPGEFATARGACDVVHDKMNPAVIREILSRVALPVPDLAGVVAETPVVVSSNGASKDTPGSERINANLLSSFGVSAEVTQDSIADESADDITEEVEGAGEEAHASEGASGHHSADTPAKAAFAKDFLEAEEREGGPLSSHATKAIGRKHGISVSVYRRILDGVSKLSSGRITLYKSNDQTRRLAGAQVTVEAEVSAEEEPDDPIERAQWLAINLEYFEGQRDFHQTQVDHFSAQIERSRAATASLEQLKNL